MGESRSGVEARAKSAMTRGRRRRSRSVLARPGSRATLREAADAQRVEAHDRELGVDQRVHQRALVAARGLAGQSVAGAARPHTVDGRAGRSLWARWRSAGPHGPAQRRTTTTTTTRGRRNPWRRRCRGTRRKRKGRRRNRAWRNTHPCEMRARGRGRLFGVTRHMLTRGDKLATTRTVIEGSDVPAASRLAPLRSGTTA